MIQPIAILGGNIRALSSAHAILDSRPDAEVHIIEEAAEIGLTGETPGIISRWPIVPTHWLSELGSQEPKSSSGAVRRSWLEKAMATSLASRGCTFHLRTRVEDVSQEDEVSFVGAGVMGSGKASFGTVLDMRTSTHSDKEWEGGVCNLRHSPSFGIQGERPDRTIEVWWRGQKPDQGKWVHRMRWAGDDPASSLEDDIGTGAEAAKTLIDTIIQP
tara:strand:- start:95 stop:742 length:648 start_codon:yes stop_codon:yes gene_type:complete